MKMISFVSGVMLWVFLCNSSCAETKEAAAILGNTFSNLMVNGDFESDNLSFGSVLAPGVKAGVVFEGFESDHRLEITVPMDLRTTDNYFCQKYIIPENQSLRSYRLTFWLRHKVLSDSKTGGAGVRVKFLNSEEAVVGSADKLLCREDIKNQWQAIDQIKDGWWDSYELEFMLPADAVTIQIECGLFSAAGNADFDRLILVARPRVEELLARDNPVVFEVTEDVVKTELSDLLFCINAEFRYAGIYRGTLPESDPRNLRREFAAALRKAGIKVLRFPGGMPSHQYFVEGPQAREKFFQQFPDKSYYYKTLTNYPAIGDVVQFCKDFGFDLMFQTNTMFFVDSSGNIRPINKNKESKAYFGSQVFDNTAAAAAALGRFMDSLPSPDSIHYWEIGNEEFALMGVNEYAAIVTAFSREIKSRNPDAVIIVAGNTWLVELCRRLKESDALKNISQFSLHYPWGDHWRPEVGGETNLRRFVCGTLNWEININAHTKMLDQAGIQGKSMAASETSVFKFHTWNAHRVIYTPAHGLLLAANWIEAVKIPALSNLAFHDMESPYFGMILFDQYFDPVKQSFDIIKPGVDNSASVTDNRYYLKDRYLVLPSGIALGRMARHRGWNIVDSRPAEPEWLLDHLASIRGKNMLFTVVNRGEKPRQLTVRLPHDFDKGAVTVNSTRWPNLNDLPQPPIEKMAQFYFDQQVVLITVEPFSITQMEIIND